MKKLIFLVALVGLVVLTGCAESKPSGIIQDSEAARRMSQILETNPLGQPTYWQDQNSGITYTVMPIRNVSYNDNPYCREYRLVANLNGQRQQDTGTACRQLNGSWRIQESHRVLE